MPDSDHNVCPDGMPPEIKDTHPCVFVSHRKADKPLARAVANFLEAIELHYWFDERDLMLDQARRAGKSGDQALVHAIDMGVDHSTQLVGIISPNTTGSWWVPYEIGRARGKLGADAKESCCFLVVPGTGSLPEFIRAATPLREVSKFTRWAAAVRELRQLEELQRDFRERAEDPVESEIFGAGWGEELYERIESILGRVLRGARESRAELELAFTSFRADG